MTNKLPVLARLAFILFFTAQFSRADQVTLNSGTVISGTIISENAEEIAIINSGNMVLHLDRTIIRHVERTKEETSSNQLVVVKQSHKPKPSQTPSIQPTPKTTSTQAITTATPSAEIPAAPKPAQPAETKPAAVEVPVGQTWKVGIVDVTETQVSSKAQLNDVGDDAVKLLDALQSSYSATWSGTTKKDGAVFAWKSVKVVSTTTTPALPKQKKIDEKTQQDVATQLQGDQKIQSEALHSLADSFPLLQGTSEADLKQKSEQMFNETMERADKRRRGHHRLSSHSARPAVKK